MPNRIRALLLDADGVLIDGEPARAPFEREFGIKPEVTRDFFRGVFRDCMTGKADLKECLAPLLPAWGWPGSVQDYLDYWFKAEHHLDEALLADVDRLRSAGVLCYLATNQERYRTEYIRDVMGLGKRLDGIFSSACIGHLKDDRRFFEHIIEDLASLRPEEMLFFDDLAANVASARGAGLHAELYVNREGFRGALGRFSFAM
jgi:putative hydrolase of the HAD superfamily